MGNTALAMMLFDKFENQVREDLSAIQSAITAQNAEKVRRISHALKGAAGALSATLVQQTAARIELAARENRMEAVATCFSDLKSEVDRCLEYLPDARAAVKRPALNPTH